ncbi:MAG: M23 family metallopeptidase [Phaeodactylibacter sp.]|nr:M23 family metallopeptidase [Phaeodactylibacter sp.]MCB9263817.1 M23 family metallopeptidase [Lewinellaceae bacterium]MCB9288262.1 M23 family metallopeptidase [Lewinellaceae bacterium]
MRYTSAIPIILLLLSFTFGEDEAYPQHYFSAPVPGPLRLSGTFGELRPGHFHAGIDIKGKVGDALLAAAEGYVSRITVSPDGYGKVLYLSHPNGYTTVYAHLAHFSPELEAYVRSHQYAIESYAVDLQPEPGQFTFKPGAVIGAMGMTGHSFGPHLHFEVRGQEGNTMINPLEFGLPVADHRPPFMGRLRLYAIDREGDSHLQNDNRLSKGREGRYRLEQGDTLYTHSPLSGLGLEVFDHQDGTANRNGAYSLKLYFDDSLAYYFNTERFQKEETRYLNAHLDYRALQEDGFYFNRLYRMPGNGFSDYVKTGGLISLRPGETANVLLEAGDIAGNTAKLNFVLKRAKGPLKITHPYYNYRLPFNEESAIQTPSLELYFPENSFYENLDLHYEPILEDSYGIYSLAHQIHYPATPVHHYFQIGVRPTILIPDQLKSRAFVALCSPGGAIVNCGGEWKDGFLQTRVRSFGTYCILADEEAPSILPLNLKEDMSRAASIAFRVKDNYETAANVPGLKYRGTIDGHWVLFEYDAKHGQLEYFFENTLAQGRHQLRLEVEDAVGNIALFEYQFRR